MGGQETSACSSHTRRSPVPSWCPGRPRTLGQRARSPQLRRVECSWRRLVLDFLSRGLLACRWWKGLRAETRRSRGINCSTRDAVCPATVGTRRRALASVFSSLISSRVLAAKAQRSNVSERVGTAGEDDGDVTGDGAWPSTGMRRTSERRPARAAADDASAPEVAAARAFGVRRGQRREILRASARPRADFASVVGCDGGIA